ncbi:putative decapping nuclease [[Candida] railenensis]|uniref:Decapping nuclease n=1 Tax=[Candida] railenensis TaxID=45579 RepID=A0A9P0QUZ6_9ASCO|nr:putative decapping nuclease [[Candida] railenensis]
MERSITLQASELFSRLSHKQLTNSNYDLVGEEKLIRGSTSNDLSPTQCMYFSKPNASAFVPNSTESLRTYKLPVGKPKTKDSRSKKVIHDKSKVIGTNLSEGWRHHYVPATLDEVFKLNDLFLAVDEQLSKDAIKADQSIVSLRRILLLLMTIPLHPTKSYTFNIIPWNNLLIIDFDSTEDELVEGLQKLGIDKKERTPSWVTELQYTGFKFEEAVTCRAIQEEDKITDGESLSSFYTFTRHQVGSVPVYCTAEIDATIKGNSNLASYIELKTHTKGSTLDYGLTRKLVQSWCQTKFINGKYLSIGFRKRDTTNTHFKLAAIKTYQTNDIPDIVQAYPIYMNKDDKGSLITCQKLLRWYQVVLTWIARECSDKKTGYKLRYCDDKLTLAPLSSTIHIQKEKIPSWFRAKYPTTT